MLYSFYRHRPDGVALNFKLMINGILKIFSYREADMGFNLNLTLRIDLRFSLYLIASSHIEICFWCLISVLYIRVNSIPNSKAILFLHIRVS